jgi:hypothetical protein
MLPTLTTIKFRRLCMSLNVSSIAESDFFSWSEFHQKCDFQRHSQFRLKQLEMRFT